MKNLIYQFWNTQHQHGIRKNLPGVKASWKSIKTYADRIGAVHLAEENPPLLHNLPAALYYGAFNPIFREEFHEYDNVLFVDSDVFAVDGLEENIFEGFDADIGVCFASLLPKLRANTKVGKINKQQEELWTKSVEEKWNIKIPRTKEGYPKVCNSGVVLYSNAGMKTAKDTFLPFKEYINYMLSIKELGEFYIGDENYLFVTLLTSKINFVELDNSWNTLMLYHDRDHTRVIFDRTKDTKFVHTMGIVGAHHYNEELLWKMTNLPVEKWGVGKRNVTKQIKK